MMYLYGYIAIGLTFSVAAMIKLLQASHKDIPHKIFASLAIGVGWPIIVAAALIEGPL